MCGGRSTAVRASRRNGVTKVVVVGAGIAGLGAAYSMQKAGVEVSVLESTPHVGGRMRSMEWNGAWIDLGAEFIATPGFDEMLFHELGIMKDRVAYPGGDVSFNVWRNGAAHPFSYTDPSGVLRFGGLTWWRRPVWRGCCRRTCGCTARLGGRYDEPWRGAWADDESVGEWLGRVAPAFSSTSSSRCSSSTAGGSPRTSRRARSSATVAHPAAPDRSGRSGGPRHRHAGARGPPRRDDRAHASPRSTSSATRSR